MPSMLCEVLLNLNTGPLDQMEEVKAVDKMRNYETMFIVKPDLEEEERDEIITRIKNVITKNNGEISDEDIWGTRKLAYEIEEYPTGYYVLLEFRGDNDVIDNLEYDFRILDNILKYLIINKDK